MWLSELSEVLNSENCKLFSVKWDKAKICKPHALIFEVEKQLTL